MIKIILQRLREVSIGLIVIAVILTGIGLIALNSIAQHQSNISSYDRQILFLIPSFIGLFILILIPQHIIHKYAYVAYGITLIVIALPYFGVLTAGTHRWINFGPWSFQPSEFAKWITVIAVARYLSDHKLELKKFTIVVVPIILILIPSAIVLKQPDLGTAAIIITPLLPMLYWVGARPYHLFLLVAPLLSVLTAFHMVSFVIWVTIMALIIYREKLTVFRGVITFFSNIFLGLLAPFIWQSMQPYQQKRILTLFNPELDPLGAAYQIIQSQTAIGSGGFLGKGWGQGTQTHLKFLPVQESDFIFSVIGEELGFIMILLIFLLFGWFIARMVYKAFTASDRFSSLTIIGIATIFLAHLFVNTAMTIGLIPVKGLPLPFISYGGSFLMSCYIMLGLVLNLASPGD